MRTDRVYSRTDKTIKVLITVVVVLAVFLLIGIAGIVGKTYADPAAKDEEQLGVAEDPSNGSEDLMTLDALEAEQEKNAQILPDATATSGIEGMPEASDVEAFCAWLIALDPQMLYDNIELVSGSKITPDYVAIVANTFEGEPEKTEKMLKATVLLQNANDQGRAPTASEGAYIADMQMLIFGEASPYFTGTDTDGATSTFSSDGGEGANYDEPSVAVCPDPHAMYALPQNEMYSK